MSPRPRKFLLYWLPLLAYVSLIFILSSLSRLPFDSFLGLPDKLLHFGEYALMAALMARAFRSLSRPASLWAVLALTLAAVAVLGVADELYQSTVPGRHSDPLDWVADASGGLFGALFYLLGERWWVSRAEKASASSGG